MSSCLIIDGLQFKGSELILKYIFEIPTVEFMSDLQLFLENVTIKMLSLFISIGVMVNGHSQKHFFEGLLI